MMAGCTVLLAVGDTEVAASVRRRLEKDAYRVFVACDSLRVAELVRRKQPDILMLDRPMLESEGVELHRVLEAETEMALVIVGAEGADEVLSFDTYQGISRRIGRNLEPCEVLAQVRSVLRELREELYESAPETRFEDLVIDRRCHEVRVLGEAVHLTPTEFRLLEVMAGEPGRVFTRLELLGRVFGHEYGGLERTIDTHVKNLRKKIEGDPAESVYIETVYGVGYRFSGGRSGIEEDLNREDNSRTSV